MLSLKKKWIGALLIGALDGCCMNSLVKPIDVNSITAVQSEIKRQIGVYMATVAALPSVVAAPPKPGDAGPVVMIGDQPVMLSSTGFECGTGKIDFDVSTIKAELTTTLDTTSTAKFGFSLPIPPATVGTSFGQSNEKVNAQTLDYNLWPMSAKNQDPALFGGMPDAPTIKSAPVARVLLDLRNALILAATRMDYTKVPPTVRQALPCFTDFDPANPSKDAGNLFKIALTVTSDTSGSVSIGVAPITFSVGGEAKSTSGNTLSVAFVQRGMRDIQWFRDANTQECKYPSDEKTFLCGVSGEALDYVMSSAVVRPGHLDSLNAKIAEHCKHAKAAVYAKLAKDPKYVMTDVEKAIIADCNKADILVEKAKTIGSTGAGLGVR